MVVSSTLITRTGGKFIEIPWSEVDYVMVSVFFKGHWIPRIQVVTKKTVVTSLRLRNPRSSSS
ncbi:DUF956 family protein [Limosilactobacillus fermentum]